MRVAENRHSGIPVIRDEMRRAGLRQPVFVDSRNTFTVRLYNLPEERHESIDGTGELSREALIAFCDVPRSRQEVADHFGVNVSYVAHAYLNPLADGGELVRTLPDRPRSKNQRFVARRCRQ
jgi:ATP-dependent DNA helicase RecG